VSMKGCKALYRDRHFGHLIFPFLLKAFITKQVASNTLSLILKIPK
jgi:hypothetical protein